jgi:hypothetical protein
MKKLMMVFPSILPVLFLAGCKRSAPAETRASVPAPPPVAAPVTWETNFTYRGVAFGTPQKEVERILASSSSKPLRHVTSLDDIDDIAIGSTTVREYLHYTEDGLTLVMWGFPADSYNGLKETFITKYGTPTTVSNRTVRNAMGAIYQQEELGWEGRAVHISLSRYGSKLTEGLAVFTTQKADKDLDDKERAKNAKAVGQF